jgi:hypothetical protein
MTLYPSPVSLQMVRFAPVLELEWRIGRKLVVEEARKCASIGGNERDYCNETWTRLLATTYAWHALCPNLSYASIVYHKITMENIRISSEIG